MCNHLENLGWGLKVFTPTGTAPRSPDSHVPRAILPKLFLHGKQEEGHVPATWSLEQRNRRKGRHWWVFSITQCTRAGWTAAPTFIYFYLFQNWAWNRPFHWHEVISEGVRWTLGCSPITEQRMVLGRYWDHHIRWGGYGELMIILIKCILYVFSFSKRKKMNVLVDFIYFCLLWDPL